MTSMKTKRAIFFLLFVSTVLFSCSQKRGPAETSSQSANTVGARDTSTVRPAAFVSLRLTYEQRQGKNIYRKYCFVCHGPEGKGDGFNSYNLDPKPRNLTDGAYMNSLSSERIAETVRLGGRGVNRSPLMPTWGGRLSKDEIIYVVSYVRTLAADTKARD